MSSKVSKQLKTSQFVMNRTWVVFVVKEEEKDFIQLVRVVRLDAIDDRSHFMSVGLLVNQRVDDDVRSDATKTQPGESVNSPAAFERVVIDESVGKTGIGNIVIFEEAHDGVDAVSRNLFVVFGHPFNKLEETIGGFFRTSEFHCFEQITRRNCRESSNFGNGAVDRVIGRNRRKRRRLDRS